MSKESYYDEVTQIVKDLTMECSRLKEDSQKQRENSEIEKKKILISMIELADDFERLFSIITPKLEGADKQAQKWAKNFQTVYKSLQRKMQQHNITKMNIIIGDEPHSKYHRIIDTEFSSNYPNGVIVRVEKDGYFWGKSVLREAEVIVIKNY